MHALSDSREQSGYAEAGRHRHGPWHDTDAVTPNRKGLPGEEKGQAPGVKPRRRGADEWSSSAGLVWLFGTAIDRDNRRLLHVRGALGSPATARCRARRSAGPARCRRAETPGAAPLGPLTRLLRYVTWRLSVSCRGEVASDISRRTNSWIREAPSAGGSDQSGSGGRKCAV